MTPRQYSHKVERLAPGTDDMYSAVGQRRGVHHNSLKNWWSITFPGHEGVVYSPKDFLTLGPKSPYKNLSPSRRQ